MADLEQGIKQKGKGKKKKIRKRKEKKKISVLDKIPFSKHAKGRKSFPDALIGRKGARLIISTFLNLFSASLGCLCSSAKLAWEANMSDSF